MDFNAKILSCYFTEIRKKNHATYLDCETFSTIMECSYHRYKNMILNFWIDVIDILDNIIDILKNNIIMVHI